MARQGYRTVRMDPPSWDLVPTTKPKGEVLVRHDELEAIRLADLLGLYHEEAARLMGISRPTFGRILASAREKVARALVEGLTIRLPKVRERTGLGTPTPGKHWRGRGRWCPCPRVGELELTARREKMPVRIAVPLLQGKFSSHFGRADSFAFVDVDKDAERVLGTKIVQPPPHGRGVYPNWLAASGVDVLVAGGIGWRASEMLAELGIKVVSGIEGESPEELALQWATGKLKESEGEPLCEHGEHHHHHHEHCEGHHGEGAHREDEEERMRLGAGGYCVCVNCGWREPHRRGVRCMSLKCPNCGSTLLREGSDHYVKAMQKRGGSRQG